MHADDASLKGLEERIRRARANGEDGACIKMGCDLLEAILDELRTLRASKSWIA